MEYLIIPALCLLAALVATVIVVACWWLAREADREWDRLEQEFLKTDKN
jgi:high-affinity Fe2+/Pb2+ permease